MPKGVERWTGSIVSTRADKTRQRASDFPILNPSCDANKKSDRGLMNRVVYMRNIFHAKKGTISIVVANSVCPEWD